MENVIKDAIKFDIPIFFEKSLPSEKIHESRYLFEKAPVKYKATKSAATSTVFKTAFFLIALIIDKRINQLLIKISVLFFGY